MSKFRTTILIIGILVMCAAASLITYLVLSISGAIATDPVELEFTISDREKTFDGTPLNPDGYSLTSGELMKGHRAVVEYTGAQTEVGESKSGMAVKVFDEKDFEVTNEYAIKVNGGLLTVEKCEVYIRLDDTAVPYNGGKVLFEDYTVTTGSLAEGHRAGAAKKDAGIISVNDILTESEVAPAVYDGNGKDVSYNYNIHFHMGAVRVTARAVSVKPVDSEKVYDGKPFTCPGYEITSGSLVSGHRAQVSYVTESGEEATLINAEELEAFASVTIFDKNDEDVTENYDLDLSESATLKITKRDLLLTAKSAVWEYDGEEHSLADDSEAASAQGLAEGDTVAVEYSGTITDHGEAENEIISYNITRDAENYNVTCAPGTLGVTKKKILVQLRNGTKVYDGTPLTLDAVRYDSNATDLTVLRSNLTGVKDAGEHNFTAEFDDKNGNYDITVKSATYVVSPLELTVSYVGSRTKIYDGKPFEVDPAYIRLSGENADRFEVKDIERDTIVQVPKEGETTPVPLNLRFPQLRLTETGEIAAAGNFVFGVENVNVTITRRDITIKFVSLTVSADTNLKDLFDDMATSGDFISSSTPLASGDSAKNLFDVEYDLEAGTIEVSYLRSGVISNSAGENVTHCYKCTNDGAIGSLTVIPSGAAEGETTG